MRLLFIGDIIGRPGRELLRKGLKGLVTHHGVDFVIANAENSAAGFGVTKDIGDTLLEYGVDVMTSGNHVWDKKEALDYIATERRLLRPANYPAGAPGRGSYVAESGDGRPVGIQVVADFLRDRTALTVAARISEVLGGFRPPPGYGA